MKTLTRYIGREVLASILLIFSALVMLFAFFDLIHELGDVGRGGYTITAALLFVALQLPARMYELFPVATLIGTLFGLAQLVSSSEYTVMRASGASLVQVGWALFRIGIPLAIVTFLAGEFVAPQAAFLSQKVRAQARGDTTRIVAQQFQSGFWFKQDQTFVNIRSVLADLTLVGVRIYEFDDSLRLKTVRNAESGVFIGNGQWRLRTVKTTEISPTITRVIAARRLRVGNRAAAVAAHRLPGRAGEARAQYPVGQHARARHRRAEDGALRDRLLEQGVLPGRRAGDDDRRAAVLVFPAQAGRRGIPDVRGHDPRSLVLLTGRLFSNSASSTIGRLFSRRLFRWSSSSR
jgi:hypothetical protein